jgi:hypothetical protein
MVERRPLDHTLLIVAPLLISDDHQVGQTRTAPDTVSL